MHTIGDELAGAVLGDVRRQRRLVRVAEHWWARVVGPVSGACLGWADQMGAYRLFRHMAVTLAAVLAPHRRASVARVQQERVVLMVQDTTELDYTGKPIARRAGEVGSLTYARQRGLRMHTQYLVTPDRRPLGVWDVGLEARPDDAPPPTTARPLAAKESARWLAGYWQSCVLATEVPDTQVVSVADREGDLYEIYVAAQGDPVADVPGAPPAGAALRRADWLVRAAQDRAVGPRRRGRPGRLWLDLALAPPQGWATVEVPARGTSTARHAVCTVKTLTVTLHPPVRRSGPQLPSVTVTVVAVREVAPPPGAARVEWVLLTSLPVATAAELRRVLQYYACRWEIEVFFRVLKSGCGVEQVPVQTRDRLAPCLGVCCVLAWRLHHLTRLGQLMPDVPCTVALADAEWHVLALLATGTPPPTTPPSLGTALGWLAKLGGHSGRRRDGAPGPTVLGRGLQRVAEAVRLYGLLQPATRCV